MFSFAALSDNKNGGTLVNVGLGLFAPLVDRSGTDQLIGLQQVSSHGQTSLGTAGGQKIIEQFQVTIRCLNKNLRLVFALGPAFKVTDGFVAVGLFDR